MFKNLVKAVSEEKKEEVTVKPQVTTVFPTDKRTEGKIITPSPMIEKPSPENIIKVIRNPEDIFKAIQKVEAKIEQQQKGIIGIEYFDHPNIKFMKDLPRFEMKHMHHSSIIIAKACLRKYFYQEVLNLYPKDKVTIYFPWGSAFHLYKQRLSELYGFGDNEPKIFDPDRAKKAHAKAHIESMNYWNTYGEEQKAGSRLDWFTQDRFNKTTIKAFEWWVNERKMGKIKVLAVEQFFNLQLKDGNFVEGRIDELVRWLGQLWGRDFKTTSKDEDWFVKSMLPNNQVKTYTWASFRLNGKEEKVHGLLIQSMYNAKSTKAGDKGPETYEKTANVSDYELVQWEDEQVQWNRILKDCRDNDSWPMSEVNCHFCDYQSVCLKTTEAAQVYQLEQKYVRKLRDPANLDVAE